MQKLFSINNLAGDIGEKRQLDPSVLLDIVGINEANIGQNKADYYLKRSVHQDVIIDGEGIVTEELTISYVNTSTPKSSFAGDYKALPASNYSCWSSSNRNSGGWHVL